MLRVLLRSSSSSSSGRVTSCSLLNRQILRTFFSNFSSSAVNVKDDEWHRLDGEEKRRFLMDLSKQPEDAVSQLSLSNSLQVREELLRVLKKSSSSTSPLELLNQRLKYHLESCCSRDEDFQLQRIQTSTNNDKDLLQLISRKEAVHPFSKDPETWHRELEFRTNGPRHIYGLFHSGLSDSEPLAFISVFFSDHLVGNMREILPLPSPSPSPSPSTATATPPSSAIFYSINLAMSGMQGVNVAARLIKTLLSHLLHSQPSITTFSTLSPLPSFLSWLHHPHHQLVSTSPNHPIPTILEAFKSPKWFESKQDKQLEELKELTLRLASTYILRGPDGCPVANFHLRNGARVEQLNWLADTSEFRLKQSAGVMVNYLYDPQSLAQNRTAYQTQRLLPVSPSLLPYLPSPSAVSEPGSALSIPPSVFYPIQHR